MDNDGYSNNKMNQGAANDLYPNSYEPEQEEEKQYHKAKQQTSGMFLLGILTGVAACALITSCIFVGWKAKDFFSAGHAKQTNAETKEPLEVVNEESLAKLEAIEDVIAEYYYKEEDIDAEEMIEGMYSGMVNSLGDPYSVYYTEEEWSDLMEETEGIYYGIGAYVSLDATTQFGKISGIIGDTPAQEAGLRENDILYMVDGVLTQGMELSEIVALIKGEEGTFVHITIYREGEEDYLEIDVERRKIEAPTVNYEMLDNQIGYIQITEFDEVTVDQFTEALAVIEGSNAKGLILDLRSNPGGSLPAVVDIARQVLPEGLIVYTEDRAGKRTEYSCDGKNKIQMPLVVLVNGNSASASEILAGAIKDYDIGTLVGTTTFGKGIVQRVLPLTDGTALKLTVSAYYTPKGNNIHGIGIEPDVICEFDADAYYEEAVDNQLECAKEEIEHMITN